MKVIGTDRRPPLESGATIAWKAFWIPRSITFREGYLDDRGKDQSGARSLQGHRHSRGGGGCRGGRPRKPARRGGFPRSALAGGRGRGRGGGGAVTDDRRGDMIDGNKGKSVARSISVRRASIGTGSSYREVDRHLCARKRRPDP